jgi:hypothetical protein
MKVARVLFDLGLAGALILGALAFATDAVASPIPSGWVCTGSCGSLGANGVVPLSPIGDSSYQYVTTAGGKIGAGEISGIGGTDGSSLATSVFTVTAGTDLNFYFDYVTSDGAGYADYAWAGLYTSTGTLASMLFTARTEPTGSIVPGLGLPALTATLNPSSVPIHPGGPDWSPLGGNSGDCYSAGYTGWIDSDYTIAAAGSYYLKIGVTNWIDTLYDSGLAMDGVTVGGAPINPNQGEPNATPEPSSLLLLASGLAGLAGVIRRKIRA